MHTYYVLHGVHRPPTESPPFLNLNETRVLLSYDLRKGNYVYRMGKLAHSPHLKHRAAVTRHAPQWQWNRTTVRRTPTMAIRVTLRSVHQSTAGNSCHRLSAAFLL